MKEMFTAVKAATKSALWSKGVTLAQSAKVTLESEAPGELTFRVASSGRPIPPLVVLYTEETEWTCDCGSEHDPCEHVVAAVLAQKDASSRGESVRASREVLPELAYRLESAAGPRLLVHRVLVDPDGRETPLAEPLARLLAAKKLPLQPSHEDLEVDRLLTSSGHGATRATTSHGLSAEGYERLLRALAVSRNLTLDGQRVLVNLERLVPRATIADTPLEDDLGFRLEIAAPHVRVLDRGVGLVDGVLHPLGAANLLGQRWERLPLVRTLGSRDLGELVTRVLPELEEELPVVLLSKRVPSRGGVVPPRIHFDLTPMGHNLSVLPLLVYGAPPQVRIDGDKVVHLQGDIPKRDISRERSLVHALRAELNLAVGRVVHFDGSEAAKMAKRLGDFEKQYNGQTTSAVLVRRSLRVQLSLDESNFSVILRTDDEESSEVAFEHAYRCYRDGVPMVPLASGGFAELPRDWFERYGERIQAMLAARRPDGALPLFAVPELQKLSKDLGAPPPPSFSRLAPLFESFDRLPELRLPPDLRATLRPYQELGVRWLSFLRKHSLSGVLADDMGLGKTLQAIATIEGRTLVVCPKSVLFNWVAELERFRPNLDVAVYHGTKRSLREADVTVTTYSMLRTDAETLAAGGFRTLIFDEAQALKNPESQVTQAAYRLGDTLPPDTFKLLMSGTPVENRLDELWSLFRLSHPGLLGSRRDFGERFERAIQAGDAATASRLRALIKPFLLRRLKKDVLRELPPRTEVNLEIELEPEQQRIYQSVLAMTRDEVRKALLGDGGMMAALTALLRLRQAACHTALLPGIEEKLSAKFEALFDVLEDAIADSHKCIIFSQWTSLLDLLEPELERRGFGFVRLDGSTKDRAGVVSRFQSEDGPPLFLSSLKAGGIGLNLTAADHVFLLDPWWNPAAEDQAADRAHRIGQERPVTVYRLIARGTIEPSIFELARRKRQLSEVALEEGGVAQGLTREDLLKLLDLG